MFEVGAKTEFLFKFSNIYKEDLHIVGVRSSCGCTTPNWTKEPIQPGGKGTIDVQFQFMGPIQDADHG